MSDKPEDLSSTHPDSPWGAILAKSPLGSIIERFIGVPKDSSVEMRQLQNLLYLLQMGGSRSSQRDPDFMKALTPCHRHLLALLEEWWPNYDKEETQDNLKTFIFACALVSERGRDNASQLKRLEELTPPCDVKYLRLAQQSLDDQKGLIYTAITETGFRSILYPSSQIPVKGSYHQSLYSLYLSELGPSAVDADFVEYTRADASMKAVVLQICRVCLQQVPAYTESDTHALQNRQLSLPKKRTFLRNCPKPIPITIEPCYWLRDDGFLSGATVNSSTDLPYFLWDIEGHKTVPVSEIAGSEITYAIVSHTWGRWRKQGRGVAVQGVPWLVPSISLYDVKDLPRVLCEAGFREPYLWIDLFCIPQEDTVDWQVRIRKEELPRQATIFKHASTAVAWLNDIEDWRATESALSWVAIWLLKRNVLKYSTGCDYLERGLNTLRAAASKPCGFLKNAGDESNSSEGLSRWFSSIWTLQEIIMRPDMLLLNHRLEPLILGDSLSITLEHMAALILLQRLNRAWAVGYEHPAGVKEIVTFMEETRLFSLFSTNRLTPLILGTNRTCTHSRAAAIMSVIGATDWFRDRTIEQFRSGDDTEVLVCGMYPLDFVNEAYKKIGGSFFTWVSKATTSFTINVDGEDMLHISRGTMLPFMVAHERQRRFSALTNVVISELPDHATISSWKIQANGSVFIPAAGIVASNRRTTPQQNLECIIAGNDPKNGRAMTIIVRTEADLLKFVNEFREEAHAICVMGSKQKLMGIIIQRVGEEGSFVKAGTFDTCCVTEDALLHIYEIPEEVNVNWVIL